MWTEDRTVICGITCGALDNFETTDDSDGDDFGMTSVDFATPLRKYGTVHVWGDYYNAEANVPRKGRLAARK